MSPEALREWVDALTSLFSSNAPWVWWLADAFLFVAAVWAMVRMVLDLWSKLREPFTQIRTLFFNSDRNQRTVERRRFAGHLEDRLKSLNERESWDDNRFAELEAEVEAPEREGPFAWLPKRRMPRVRRQRLSRALEQSRARLILLQGEPGSGKSVALRHVALTMARRTQTDVSKLPVYVNLKLLRPKTGQSIDRNLIADFVRRELGGPNTDIHGYVEREFEAGLKNGRWVFLFDSFDELPDVLASTDADEVVASYAKAIYEFLHGMNRCRGIIASRLFRGPKSLPWTEFRVAPLDRARRLELIDRANLTQKDRQALVLWMDGPEAPERELSNPMFVGLLCAQVKSGSAVPQSAHRVYEDYVARLFKRDAKRLGEGFGVEVASLRRFAEQVAFYMTAEGMGLEPDLVALSAVMTERQSMDTADVMNNLRALAYMKLAKVDESDGRQTFTFSHRRFQEFFATCILLREPERVEALTLLTNAFWRESTVVLLQTSDPNTLTSLLSEVHRILADCVDRVRETSVDAHVCGFNWPPLARHVCAIIQDGLRARRDLLSAETRTLADQLLEHVWAHGTHLDRKWALEIAGAYSDAKAGWALTEALDSGSVLLADAAFWQLRDLAQVPDGIKTSVTKRLIAWAKTGVVERERHKIAAYIARTSAADEWGAVLRLLASMRVVMIVLNAAMLLIALTLLGPTLIWLVVALATAFAIILLWRPSGFVFRVVAGFSWWAMVEPEPLMGWWICAALLVLTWDWSGRVVIHLGLTQWWLARICPWLVFPMLGVVLVSMLEMRGLVKFVVKLMVGLLGLAAFFAAIIGLGFCLAWIDHSLISHAPKVHSFIGRSFELLLYVGVSILMVATLLFLLGGLLVSTVEYVRFTRVYRFSRRGGIQTLEVLRGAMDTTNDSEHRIRLLELVRQLGSLPVDAETIRGVRGLEREAMNGDAAPELEDAWARLSESLIDRQHGSADTREIAGMA